MHGATGWYIPREGPSYLITRDKFCVVGEFWAQGSHLGDHQPYTATTKNFGSKKGFRRGWCTNCQNLREQQNMHHPQDCTGDVHHGFCGRGARPLSWLRFHFIISDPGS